MRLAPLLRTQKQKGVLLVSYAFVVLSNDFKWLYQNEINIKRARSKDII